MKSIIKWCLLAIISAIFLLPLARFYLVVDEEPEKVDTIIVLSGDAGRLKKAAALYDKDYADKILLSNAKEAGTTAEEAVAFGVAEQDLVLEEEATSTYTNALYTKEIMIEKGLDSAIVVSSDYHMRRVKLVFDQVYKESGIKLTYVSSLRSNGAWYLDKRNIGLTAKEFVKLPGYVLRLYKFVDLEG
ncbi:YdcF family protein [Domibacillus sp. 8LH]|uniref:YdcF family protein n=1 Tax=Domibacillus sp. 8LH TaxID=3073900 RepID=UPI003175D8A5